MSDERLLELESRLTAANMRIEELTRINVALASSLATAEVSLKRSRRNARQDGNTLRDQITVLQSRRG